MAVFVKRRVMSPHGKIGRARSPGPSPSAWRRRAASPKAGRARCWARCRSGSRLPPRRKAAPVATASTRPLYLIDADGSHLHPLVSIPEYTTCGSPEWSRDGTKIAFDARRSVQGETCVQNHVFVAAADGSWVEDLGPGGMPSWSPDGRQIAFSHWQPESGVSVMNADGSERRLLDAEGWGAEWSPRRNEIAYVISPAGGQKLCIYDVTSQDRRTLLGDPISSTFATGYLVAGRPAPVFQRFSSRRYVATRRGPSGRGAQGLSGAAAQCRDCPTSAAAPRSPGAAPAGRS